VIPTSAPTALLSKVAVAPGPATSDTPLGRPEVAVVLKPIRTAFVVPSKTLSPSGNSSIRAVSDAPSVRTNLVEKSVGAE